MSGDLKGLYFSLGCSVHQLVARVKIVDERKVKWAAMQRMWEENNHAAPRRISGMASKQEQISF